MSERLPSLVSHDVIRKWLEVAAKTPHGAFVEVGVYKGGSGQMLAELAEQQGRPVYLYDTFTGIPYWDRKKGDMHPPGDFNDVNEAHIRANIPYATITKGIFPATMLEMGPVAFVHLDCDQYQSIIESVTALLPVMADDGVIVFDDYGCLQGANNAVHDLFGTDIDVTTVGPKAMVRISGGRRVA
jgi:O-methyltransferase